MIADSTIDDYLIANSDICSFANMNMLFAKSTYAGRGDKNLVALIFVYHFSVTCNNANTGLFGLFCH